MNMPRSPAALVVLTWIVLLNREKVKARDNCTLGYWNCGDICIPQRQQCHCGGAQIQRGTQSDEYWCCSKSPCVGLGFWDKDEYGQYFWSGGGNCSNGEVLHLSQPCEGECDVAFPSISLPGSVRYTHCPPENRNTSISQCIHTAEKDNGMFTCIDRRDENPFLRKNITRSFDLSAILSKCTVPPGEYSISEIVEGSPGLTVTIYFYALVEGILSAYRTIHGARKIYGTQDGRSIANMT